jgi:hypothetical protein
LANRTFALMDSNSREKICQMRTLRTAFLLAVVAAVGLVLYGWGHFPHVSTRSLAGAGVVLLLYAVLGWKGPAVLGQQPPVVTTVAISLGLFAGAIFAGEMVLEYILLPPDNTRFGYVEFGSVFLLYLIAGVVPGFKRLPFRCSVLSGIATAVIGSLIWLIAVLACFYWFYGTERQAQVFRAEGNYDDFRRSGMADFPTFIMEDFLGAGFFHLLLGPLVAGILASVGGLVGKGVARLRKA